MRYILPDPEEIDQAKERKKSSEKMEDDLMPDKPVKGGSGKQGKNKDHVRLNAIKIFLLVVDAARNNDQLL